MRHPKQLLVALSLGAVVAGGGATLVAVTSSSPVSATPTSTHAAAPAAGAATINAASAVVGGKSEQILVNSRGLPLYTFDRDTSTKSQVSGTLAGLWPPLVSASPSETGANGKVSVLADANGQQVLYNGHFLYTFVNDTPGQVTGQGVQGFFVATPGLTAGSGRAAPAPAVTHSTYSYGY